MVLSGGIGGGLLHFSGLYDPYFLHGNPFLSFAFFRAPPFSRSNLSSLNEELDEPRRVGDVADGFSPWASGDSATTHVGADAAETGSTAAMRNKKISIKSTTNGERGVSDRREPPRERRKRFLEWQWTRNSVHLSSSSPPSFPALLEDLGRDSKIEIIDFCLESARVSQAFYCCLHRTRGDLNTGRREQEGGERSEVMTLSGDRTKEERPSQTRNLIHNVLSPLQSIKSELEIIRVASMQWDSVSAQRAIRALGRRVSKGLPFRDQAQAHPTMM